MTVAEHVRSCREPCGLRNALTGSLSQGAKGCQSTFCKDFASSLGEDVDHASADARADFDRGERPAEVDLTRRAR